MTPTVALDHPSVTARRFRPLLGSMVVVHTTSGSLRGVLLSYVKDSAWLVVDDADVVVPLADIAAIRAA
jgi:hypothetical protein